MIKTDFIKADTDGFGFFSIILSIVNCQLSIVSYFCMRIDVDRFVLLATTGKNAKNISFSLPSGRKILPSSIQL